LFPLPPPVTKLSRVLLVDPPLFQLDSGTVAMVVRLGGIGTELLIASSSSRSSWQASPKIKKAETFRFESAPNEKQQQINDSPSIDSEEAI